ncbi:MAG: polysaccharide deacetylase [Ruminococcaceae bacterium]|nr:polysaccharide deacetylase [Oscillospiraceae bacterium]
MKKLMVILLAAAMVFALSGCFGSGEETSSGTGSNQTSSAGSSTPSVSSMPDSSSMPNTSSTISDGTSSAMSDEMTNVISSDATPTVTPSFTDLAELPNESIVWGPGKTTDEKRPSAPVQLQAAHGDRGAVFLGPDEKKIYLTFDEGYENGFTPAILDTLKEKNVTAMFFVTGSFAKRNPELIRRIIEEGHVLGNHSWNHPQMETVSVEKGAEEITKLHDLIYNEYQYTMKYFRPPTGTFSQRTLALTQSLGYKSVFWSFAYKDWDPANQPDEDYALEKCLSSTHPGAVFLLHAVSSTNTHILGDFIDGARQKGYEFADPNLL